MATYEQLGTRTPDGLKIGAASTDKISLHGSTPCVQAVHIADATDATTALTRINAILVVLEDKGLTASA